MRAALQGKGRIMCSGVVFAALLVPVLVGGLVETPALARASGGTATVVVLAPWRYSPNPVEVNQGDTLTFANLDPLSPFTGDGHSLSQAVKPGQELFKSPIVPPGTSAPVTGVERLPKGDYRFTCRVHAFMNGKLVVR